MAISLTSTPKAVMPVYNPIWFNLTSTNVAQPNFKYLFQIYTGTAATGTPLATIKLLPRPVTNNCIFSPARILESVLSYDSSSLGSINGGVQNIISGVTSYNHTTNYYINFGEEYGPLSGVTQYTGLTHSTGYTFNGVLEYDQVPYWNPNIGSIIALTEQPNDVGAVVYVKNDTDRGTLSFFDYGATGRYIGIDIYHADGTDTYHQIIYNGWSGASPDNRVVHVPSGPWNWNNVPQSLFTTSGSVAGNIIDVTSDTGYTVWMIDNYGYTSESKGYVIDTRCSKYETVRVQFLNRLGGFDYFNFNLVSRKTANVTRNSYKQNLAYNYSVGDREKTTLDVDGNYVYQLNSDWISNAEMIWLEELLTSTNINIINSDGSPIPVQMLEDTLEIKKTINDNLFNVTFSFESSASILSQRS